jgi:hypothetical protein
MSHNSHLALTRSTSTAGRFEWWDADEMTTTGRRNDDQPMTGYLQRRGSRRSGPTLRRDTVWVPSRHASTSLCHLLILTLSVSSASTGVQHPIADHHDWPNRHPPESRRFWFAQTAVCRGRGGPPGQTLQWTAKASLPQSATCIGIHHASTQLPANISCNDLRLVFTGY